MPRNFSESEKLANFDVGDVDRLSPRTRRGTSLLLPWQVLTLPPQRPHRRKRLPPGGSRRAGAAAGGDAGGVAGIRIPSGASVPGSIPTSPKRVLGRPLDPREQVGQLHMHERRHGPQRVQPKIQAAATDSGSHHGSRRPRPLHRHRWLPVRQRLRLTGPADRRLSASATRDRVALGIPVRSHFLAGLHPQRFARHLRSAAVLFAMLNCINAVRSALPCGGLSGEYPPV